MSIIKSHPLVEPVPVISYCIEHTSHENKSFSVHQPSSLAAGVLFISTFLCSAELLIVFRVLSFVGQQVPDRTMSNKDLSQLTILFDLSTIYGVPGTAFRPHTASYSTYLPSFVKQNRRAFYASFLCGFAWHVIIMVQHELFQIPCAHLYLILVELINV